MFTALTFGLCALVLEGPADDPMRGMAIQYPAVGIGTVRGNRCRIELLLAADTVTPGIPINGRAHRFRVGPVEEFVGCPVGRRATIQHSAAVVLNVTTDERKQRLHGRSIRSRTPRGGPGMCPRKLPTDVLDRAYDAATLSAGAKRFIDLCMLTRGEAASCAVGLAPARDQRNRRPRHGPDRLVKAGPPSRNGQEADPSLIG